MKSLREETNNNFPIFCLRRIIIIPICLLEQLEVSQIMNKKETGEL